MSGQCKKIKLDDSSNYSILDLNDDCLFEILSYLRLGDLCRVGGTCIRLNDIAQTFYSHYTTINMQSFDSAEFANYDTFSMIIKQIGHHVESFHLNYNLAMFTSLILELVFKYCTKLKEFTTSYSALGEDFESQKIIKSKIFKNLESIHLVYNTSYSTKLGDFVKLKNLKKFGFFSKGRWPRNKNEEFLKLHNLESLSVNVLDVVGYDICEKLFDNNPRINKLNLFDGLNDGIINLLVDKLMYLEDLSVDEPKVGWVNKLGIFTMREVSDQAMMKISEINNLKHFRSWKVPRCLLKRLVQNDQLESLTSSTEIPEELVTKFTKLKFLSITNVNDTVLNSLKSQKTLEKLELRHENITADCLIKFVSGATNLKYLSLSSHFDDFPPNESTVAFLKPLFEYFNRQKKIQFVYNYYVDL